MRGKREDLHITNLPSLEERKLIRNVFEEWAENHPYKDEPLIQFLDGSQLTPVDIAKAFSDFQSEKGKFLYKTLILNMQEEGKSLPQVLDVYKQDTMAWKSF